ncbi:CG0192-related protein [Actinoplanes sp. CA-015351]|uniref:CG0192-related protein n=1 Tax=Actinoplanes sp. CA-015351 TaxID=3239897 RepID=UPI003D97FD14
MALLHKAHITPTKLELLAAWLPARPWYAGDGPLTRVAAARFDDPAGEVGVETLLVRAGEGPVLHVPVTYRGAPLDGAEEHLIGVTEHSVLGKRWVYDGTADPVYVSTLVEVIRTAGNEAVEEFEVDGGRVSREVDLKLTGSGAEVAPATEITGHRDGDPTVISTATVTLNVNRVPLIVVDPADKGVLSACWTGQETPAVLVHLR